MKKVLLLLAMAMTVAISCNKTPVEDPAELLPSGFYVMNNGNWGDNNANIGIYDTKTKSLAADVFGTVNGKALGDLGQDILVDDENVYIAVNGSKVVFVTDKDLKIKKEIVATEGGNKLSPRYLAKGSKGIYVSYYEGYVGLISADGSVKVTAVGPNPEGVACVDGKVYVANSGGYLYPTYNNTVSVVDEATFKEVSTITVNTNPATIKACGSKLYLLSLGDYGMIPSMLQCIDATSGTVSTVDCSSPSAIALCDETLYALCGGYDAEWKPLPGSVNVFDAKTGTKKTTFSQTVENAYSISATTGYVWVGASDYKTNGDMYVFTSDGTLYDKFDTQGLNPQAVAAQ